MLSSLLRVALKVAPLQYLLILALPFLFFSNMTTLALQTNNKDSVNMALVLQGGPDGTKEGTGNALALQGAKEACISDLPASSGFLYKSCTLRTLTPASETLGAYSGLISPKSSENDFMMALGYFPSKAIQTAANANGNKLFAIVDFEFTPPVGNIVSVMYLEDQIGYLAGLLAGEVAKTRGGKVAVIGGVDQPSVRRQVNGFGNGVKVACSTCHAYGIYAGTFDADVTISTTVMNVLKSHKVAVIFNAASIFGTMTLKNLTTQDGIYGIGSGSDEWITNWAYGSVPGSEHILTSVQMDYTVVVRSVMQSVLRANLTGGSTVFFGVNPDPKQSAIKLAPAHEASNVFTKQMQDKMQGYIADMAKGKLTTGVDHKSGESRSSGSSSTSVELLALNGDSSKESNSNDDGNSDDAASTTESTSSSSNSKDRTSLSSGARVEYVTHDPRMYAGLLTVFMAIQVATIVLSF